MFQAAPGIESKMIMNKQMLLHYKIVIQDFFFGPLLLAFQQTSTMEEPSNNVAEWEKKLLGKVLLEDDAQHTLNNDEVKR